MWQAGQDDKKMKKLIYLLACISLACTSQLAPAVTMDSQTITKPPKVVVQTAIISQMMVVNSGGLNVRECAGTGCAPVGLLQDGDIVTLTGKTEIPLNGVYTWYEISAPVAGWVSGRYLSNLEASLGKGVFDVVNIQEVVEPDELEEVVMESNSSRGLVAEEIIAVEDEKEKMPESEDELAQEDILDQFEEEFQSNLEEQLQLQNEAQVIADQLQSIYTEFNDAQQVLAQGLLSPEETQELQAQLNEQLEIDLQENIQAQNDIQTEMIELGIESQQIQTTFQEQQTIVQ